MISLAPNHNTGMSKEQAENHIQEVKEKLMKCLIPLHLLSE